MKGAPEIAADVKAGRASAEAVIRRTLADIERRSPSMNVSTLAGSIIRCNASPTAGDAALIA